MKYLVIVQARCGSSRLPQKVLMNLGGKTVIEQVVERVQKSIYIDEVIVATSIEKENLELIKICAQKNIRVFIGSENDVLDRYYQVSKLFNPEYVIRITGDCPVIDYTYIDLAIEEMQPGIDYLAPLSETFPDGLDIEIIKMNRLKEIWEKAELISEREHVTLYIKNHLEKYKVKDLICPISNIGQKRWTLDEKADYELLSYIFDYFEKIGQKNNFITKDILRYLNDNQELEKINRNIRRNEGLQKSLQNDSEIEKKE